MSKTVQHKGGTTAQHSSYTGSDREITVDTSKHTVVVHDGSTVGGYPLATETNLNSHTSDSDIHITTNERASWNSKAEGSHTHTESDLSLPSYWTKSDLASTGGDGSKVDWSQVANVPAFGSEQWLDPVVDHTALSAVTGMSANDCVLVQDDGDGKAAQYSYNGTDWVKIADVDWDPLTGTEVKSLYEANADTNAFTDTEKSKLAGIANNANNYSLPIATSGVLGGVKSGTDITIDASGFMSVNDDSHNHITSNIDGLDTALSNRATKTESEDWGVLT